MPTASGHLQPWSDANWHNSIPIEPKRNEPPCIGDLPPRCFASAVSSRRRATRQKKLPEHRIHLCGQSISPGEYSFAEMGINCVLELAQAFLSSPR